MDPAAVRGTLLRERQLIIEERDRLEGDLRGGTRLAVDGSAGDEGGDARGLGASADDVAAVVLGRIDGALRRLKEGRYGACALCDGEIAPLRHEALPYATTCVACEQLIEEGR